MPGERKGRKRKTTPQASQGSKKPHGRPSSTATVAWDEAQIDRINVVPPAQLVSKNSIEDVAAAVVSSVTAQIHFKGAGPAQ